MEFFSILSGVALVALALFPGGGLSGGRRAGIVALGVLFAGYGFFVMTRTSGTWTFPAIIFVLPFLIAFVLVGDILEARRKAAAARAAGGVPTAPASRPGVPAASLPSASLPAASLPAASLPAASLPVAGATSSACLACGAELRPEVRWCTQCGVQRTLPAPMAGRGAAASAPLPMARLAAMATAPGPTTSLPVRDDDPTAPATRPAWLSQRNLLIGGGALAAIVVVAVVVGQLGDDGPSAEDQASVRGSLLAAASESLCLDPASEGRYFASEISTVITDDVWADSPAYAAVVEEPFVLLATQCGYEYGLTALNAANVVGITYQAVDAAMLAAAPAVVAEPEPQPQPQPENPTKPEAEPTDVDLSGLPAEVSLTGGASVDGFGVFAPEAEVIAYLTDRLGPPSEMYPVSCDAGATVGRQYRWGDLLVFVYDEDLSYEDPVEGRPVTVEAPFIGGWMLTGEAGQRTWLRTSEGLGIDDGVGYLQELYPEAYSLDPGDGGPVAWEYFAGDMTSYLFYTTGTGPDDYVLSIRSGSTCER